MSKLIYKPTKMYQDDINDMVEVELAKGGQGSGVRGHSTQPKIAQVSPKRSITVPGDHSDGPKIEQVSPKRSITVPGSESPRDFTVSHSDKQRKEKKAAAKEKRSQR